MKSRQDQPESRTRTTQQIQKNQKERKHNNTGIIEIEAERVM